MIGHFNGGDISMIFYTLYPEMVSKIILLYNGIYSFPKDNHINILLFGANNDEPDQGIVPSLCTEVIYVKDAKHIELCDKENKYIKKAINKFLNE